MPLALAIACATGCMLSPFDGQRVESTADPVRFWGFLLTADDNLEVQAWDGNRFVAIDRATSSTEASGHSASAKRDLFEWNAGSVRIPSRFWHDGLRGAFARVRARYGSGARNGTITVNDDWVSCYNSVSGEDDPLDAFRKKCESNHSPEARVYTENFVPKPSAIGDKNCKYGEFGCNRCVEDVEGQFARLGRKNGAKTASGRIRFRLNKGKALAPSNVKVTELRLKRHVQGFARLPGVGSENWFVVSRSQDGSPDAGFMLAQLADMSGRSGRRLIPEWRNRDEFYGKPASTVGREVKRNHVISGTTHASGVQTAGGTLAIGAKCESGGCSRGWVDFFDVRRPTSVRRISRATMPTGTNVHYVAFARMANGHHILLANRNDAGMFSVFVSDRPSLSSSTRWIWSHDQSFGGFDGFHVSNQTYQNASIVTECGSGQMYFVAMRSVADKPYKSWWTEGMAYLFKLDTRPRGRTDELVLDHVANQRIAQTGDSCELRGGASIHVDPNGEMILYCSEGYDRGSNHVEFAENTVDP